MGTKNEKKFAKIVNLVSSMSLTLKAIVEVLGGSMVSIELRRLIE